METIAKPRINGSMLSSHMGQYVCVVGKNLGVSQTQNLESFYSYDASIGFTRWFIHIC